MKKYAVFDLASKLITWFSGGVLYVAMEGIFRRGYVHISMLPVGGLVLVAVGSVNQWPRFYRMHIRWQALIATIIIFAIELASGCVMNLWLDLGVWDYSARPFNLLGQIWLPYGLLWFMLAPLAIWFEDFMQWMVWSWRVLRGKYPTPPTIPPYTLGSIYHELLAWRRKQPTQVGNRGESRQG